MAIAAVPSYLQKDDPEFYLSAPPGHRFSLYFPVWGENGETGRPDWRKEDRVRKMKKGNPVGWEDEPNEQFACAVAAGKNPPFSDDKPRARRPKVDSGLKPWHESIDALVARQTEIQRAFGSEVLRLDAIATAPFTTGLGNEHPLENGFAFLNPYGLPYLPGSGVKGVLRQAARELASGEWGDTHGWDETVTIHLGDERKPKLRQSSVIDLLFGFESRDGGSEHFRGVLSFWDVIPRIKGNSLAVEIMTPHQNHYYQPKTTAGSTTPHDSGQLKPICFLTVPPGSEFTFHVVCDTVRLRKLAPEIAENKRWETLLRAAFEHAFQWLGFGAKTAVGYGAMVPVSPEAAEASRSAEEEASKRCTWVDETIERLVKEHHQAKPLDILRGKVLAQEWAALTDTALKGRAKIDIRSRWEKQDWWNAPQGKASRSAREIYGD